MRRYTSLITLYNVHVHGHVGAKTPTCICILMRSRGAEMVLDTAADIPPAAQCRDQTSNSVNPSVVGVVLFFDNITMRSYTVRTVVNRNQRPTQ